MSEAPAFTIRAAEECDIPAVTRINAYYVTNTVLSFVEEPATQEEMVAKFRSVGAEGLPYIVAVSTTTPQSNSNSPADDTPPSPDEVVEVVLGYAYVKGFRGMKGAYRHTVELSLYCHPDRQGKGVGTALLRALLEALREPASHRHLYSQPGDGAPPDQSVRHILAVMAVDAEGKRGGLALKEFYEGFGFVLRGHLKEVGFKFGRWVDTMYLQLTL